MDSEPIQEPFFGPQLPVYPLIPQVLHVVGVALPNTNVYPAFVTQFNVLIPRDREQAYVLEPNGILLQPAYYDARLVGSYLGLPLFVTSCCPTGVASSQSA